MANALFVKAKESFISQSPSIDMDSDNIKIVGIDEGVVVPDPTTHQFLSSISSGVVFTSGNMTLKTVVGGVFDAQDETITGVSGSSFESLVIFKDTTVVGTSPLVEYINVATGLPFTPSGGDVTIEWDNGASKIFAI